MTDSEKVLLLMKYLHFSSVHRENEFKQAQENILRARPADTFAHLEYYRACCEWEMYNRIYDDIAKILFGWF